METQDVDGIKPSIRIQNYYITLELDINLDTSAVTGGTQKRQRYQQHGESKWWHKEGIKRSQRDIPFVSHKELEDDLDDLDQPKCCRYGANCILGQCNCIEKKGEQITVIQSLVIHTNDETRQSEDHMKPGLFEIRNFMNSGFAAEKTDWKQNKKRCGWIVENKG